MDAVHCCHEHDAVAKVPGCTVLLSCLLHESASTFCLFDLLFYCVNLQSIGAINTIIRKSDGKLVGYNTDYVGAISAIEDGIGGFSNLNRFPFNSYLGVMHKYHMIYVPQVWGQRMLLCHHCLAGLLLL